MRWLHNRILEHSRPAEGLQGARNDRRAEYAAGAVEKVGLVEGRKRERGAENAPSEQGFGGLGCLSER